MFPFPGDLFRKMAAPLLSKADRWITGILSYPGIDTDTLAQKKSTGWQVLLSHP